MAGSKGSSGLPEATRCVMTCRLEVASLGFDALDGSWARLGRHAVTVASATHGNWPADVATLRETKR